MFLRLIIIPLLFVNLLYGCTTHYAKTEKTKGVYHRVKGGETLWSIAKAYKINVQELAEINNISDPKLMEQDRILFIPNADEVIDDIRASVSETEHPEKTVAKEERETRLKHEKEGPPIVKVQTKAESLPPQGIPKVKTETSPKGKSKQTTATAKQDESNATIKTTLKQEVEQKAQQRIKERDNGGESEKIKFDKERFIWPVKGRVRTKFGSQPNNMYYNGIEIVAKEGTQVLAAANGTVIFSDSTKCCGETIIIKHEDNYTTVYYNLGNRIVKVHDQVKKGSHIASPGKSVKKGEACLNFEIRYKKDARDPLFFLP
ncbi:MAG: peptidoglycan DD-metalloendopeptidase family protein [Syntrophaceae bacterium]